MTAVRRQPSWDEQVCTAAMSEKPGEIDLREIDPEAELPAHTEFRVVARYPDGTTRLQARLLTGRTNQIRLHLCHLGLSGVGDPVYRSDREHGVVPTIHVGDPPLQLHA